VLAGAGQIDWAIAATAGGSLVAMLLSVLLAGEEPLQEEPDVLLGPPMLRVLGMTVAAGLGGMVAMAVAVMIGFYGLSTHPERIPGIWLLVRNQVRERLALFPPRLIGRVTQGGKDDRFHAVGQA
jgi:hypothetical protein